MSHGHLAAGIFSHNRLGIAWISRARCRISYMANRDWIIQPFEDSPPGTKDTADLPHAGEAADEFPIAGSDAGRFLAAMLKAVKPKIGFLYRFGISENSENPTFFTFLVHISILRDYLVNTWKIRFSILKIGFSMQHIA